MNTTKDKQRSTKHTYKTKDQVTLLFDLLFICMFCSSLFVFSGVRVTRSLVYMYVL
jgi:hypothetical protein